MAGAAQARKRFYFNFILSVKNSSELPHLPYTYRCHTPTGITTGTPCLDVIITVKLVEISR